MKGAIYAVSDSLKHLPVDTTTFEHGRNGYIYAIKAGDVVKVGQSANPASRIRSHLGGMRTFGKTPDRFWVSPYHARYLDNEAKIIDAASSIGRPLLHGRESFLVDFDQVVQAAQDFDYSERTPVNQRLDARKELLGRVESTAPVWIPYPGQISSRQSNASKSAHLLLGLFPPEELSTFFASREQLDRLFGEVMDELSDSYDRVSALLDEMYPEASA